MKIKNIILKFKKPKKSEEHSYLLDLDEAGNLTWIDDKTGKRRIFKMQNEENRYEKMKCIGQKCKYAIEHDFYHSCLVCSISHKTFKRDSTHFCIIDDVIKEKREYIECLEKQKKIIQAKNRRN